MCDMPNVVDAACISPGNVVQYFSSCTMVWIAVDIVYNACDRARKTKNTTKQTKHNIYIYIYMYIVIYVALRTYI